MTALTIASILIQIEIVKLINISIVVPCQDDPTKACVSTKIMKYALYIIKESGIVGV